MDYGNILSRAAKIVSKHKILWLFGILASCGSGTKSSSSNYNFNSSDFSYNGGTYRFQSIPDEYIALFIAAMCFIFVLAIVFYLIGIVGRVALIKGTHQVEEGAESLGIGQLFKDSQPYILRAIGLNILIVLAVMALPIVIIFAFVILTLPTLGFIWFLLIPLICLIIPMAIFIGIIVEQANIALVVEDLDVFEALKRGWQVCRDNLSSVVVMGIILVLGILLLTFIVSIPLIIVVVPAIIGLALESQYSTQSGIVIAGICLVIYLPVYLLLSGILQSFFHSAWTLTFLELSGASTDESVEAIPAAT